MLAPSAWLPSSPGSCWWPTSAWRVDVLRPRTTIQPAVVAIPLDITSDAEILLLSALINITPGSVTIDLSEDRRTLFVHVMHMTSPEASRLDIKTGFEQRVKRLFE